MNHFIHYLRREIKKYHKVGNFISSEEQNPEDGFDRPMFHSTQRRSGPALKIEKGSVIWLFSSLKSPWGTLPPSLDAKFIVENIEHLPDGEIKYYASEDSKWFPLHNATVILKNLKTIDGKSKERELWKDHGLPLGLYMQSIRQLCNGAELLLYEEHILNSEYDFISYRIKDGTRPAFMITENLIKGGATVFWDRYCLPRRLVERRETANDKKLDEYLVKMISRSSRVFGIESPLYSEKTSYSLKEADLAKSLKKYSPVKI